MSQQRRWKRPIAERARRFVGAVARRHYLSIAAVVLAVAACVTLAPRALSNAAAAPGVAAAAAPTVFPTATSTVGPTTPLDDEGVTWTSANDAEQDDGGSGNCNVFTIGTISGANSDIIAQVDGALVDEPANDGGNPYYDEDGIGPELIGAPASGTTTGTSMTVQGTTEVNCDLITQSDAFFKKAGYGSLNHFSHAVLDAYQHPAAAGSRPVLLAYVALPQFLKNAIAAIVGAVLYITVSSIVAAALVALGASLTPAGVLAAPLLAAVAGCIGGAVSTAATLFISGSSKTLLDSLGAAVAGCITGGLTAVLPIAKIGAYLGNALRTALGFAPAPIVGTGIAAAAETAAVELSPVTSAISTASRRFSSFP